MFKCKGRRPSLETREADGNCYGCGFLSCGMRLACFLDLQKEINDLLMLGESFLWRQIPARLIHR